MNSPVDTSDELYLGRVSLAITELAKGMKRASFYPSDHPILIQAITKTTLLLEEIPLPEQGLEIAVTKNRLLHNNFPLSGGKNSKTLDDLNRELYLRRITRVIFLPNLRPNEIVSFLKIVTQDVEKILSDGGIEKVLLNEKISRIWVNQVQYDKLAKILKEEEERDEDHSEEETASNDLVKESVKFDLLKDSKSEDLTIDLLLARIEKETDPAEYQSHITAFRHFLLPESPEKKLNYSIRAISLFVRHIESPPEGNLEIATLAAQGIRILGSDEVIGHYIWQLQTGGIRERQETEAALASLAEKAVNPLLQALAEEKDILLRKAIVTIIVRIGQIAVPAILANLNDSRWYIVRNMVMILGSFDMPDLAPYIISALSHPDLRVKRTAAKTLSKSSHPDALPTLCELCFRPERTLALTATAALSCRKEPEAVEALLRRATEKKFFYPDYRLAHEAIDSLQAIATDDAAAALEEILSLHVFWKTKNFQMMQSHALRSLYLIKGNSITETLQTILQGKDKILSREAKRILERTTTE